VHVLAVLFAALAGVLFGLLSVTVRIALRRGDPEVGALVVAAVGFAVSLVAAALGGDFSRFHARDLWPFLLVGLLVPGASQIFFIQSIRLAGPARAGIVIGGAPLGSALLAILFLGEPLRAALAGGTVLVVAGGAALAAERARPAEFRALGLAAALLCAALFGVRDNLVRAAARDSHPPALLATAASLLGACVIVFGYLVTVRRAHLRRFYRPALVAFAPSGLTLGLAYTCLVEGLDRGRVTVVAPLNATQSLWSVVIAAAVLGRSELVGRRTLLAGLLVVAGGALVGAAR